MQMTKQMTKQTSPPHGGRGRRYAEPYAAVCAYVDGLARRRKARRRGC